MALICAIVPTSSSGGICILVYIGVGQFDYSKRSNPAYAPALPVRGGVGLNIDMRIMHPSMLFGHPWPPYGAGREFCSFLDCFFPPGGGRFA